MLAQRGWTQRERRVVRGGLIGRFAIAIEPLIGMAFMAFITLGVVWRAHHVAADATLIRIAPIFAGGFVVFALYFVGVLYAPVSAYLQTFKPIYVLDGYVRYREPDEHSASDAAGYVAVLFPDGALACEWEWLGKKPLVNATIPSHVEFSTYAGIHRIDGKPTNLLPDRDIPLMAVGIAPRTGRYSG